MSPTRATLIARMLVFAAALGLGLVHVFALQRAPWAGVRLGDAVVYDRWAREIAAGDWLGQGVFYQAPLYPYFLAVLYQVVGTDLLAIRIVQVLLGAVSALLVALAVERLFDRRTGIVAGLMLAAYPPVIFSNALLQKSVLDILFVSAALWLVASLAVDATAPATRRRWLALGVILGCLALTRENAAVLVVAVLAWIGLDRRFSTNRVRPAGLLVAGVAIMLAPVAIRNTAIGGELHLTTSQFGPNFYIGNRAGADGTYDSLRPRRGFAVYEREDAVAIAEAAEGRSLTPSEVSAYFTRAAFHDIRSDPAAWLALLGRKAALLWNAVEIADSDDQYTAAEWSPLLRVTGAVWHMGVLGPLALAGVFVTWPRRRTLWPLYAMIAAYAASVVLFYVFGRYRLPVVPFLVVFAAAATVHGWSRVSRATVPAFVAASACVAGFVLVANWPLLDRNLMTATMHYNLGVIHVQAGETSEAEREFAAAVALHPTFPEALNNLGMVLGQRARFEEASQAFERALAAAPDFPEALTNSGEVLVRLGRPDVARARFERALDIDPADTRALAHLGRLLAEDGDAARAEAAYRRVLALEPDSPGAHNDLAALLGRQGRVDEAASHSSRALAIDPQNVEAESNLAVIAAAAGRLEEAATRLTRALAVDPGRPQTHYNLGVVRARQGRLDEARAAFEATLRLDPAHAQARKNLDTMRARLEEARPR